MPKINRSSKTTKATVLSRTELERVIEKCRKNYLDYPNVIAVGGGLKFVENRQVDENLCIHFYVSRKIKDSQLLSGALPKFVYSRFKDGSIDYAKKIRTDVLSLKGLRFACKAGAALKVIGESGAVTLIFQNKVSGQSKYYYAITCAHVAGNIRRTPPIDPTIKSSCCNNNPDFAITIANSTQKNQRLAYDIALAQITDSCTPQPELEINRSPTKIKGFLPSRQIRTSMTLGCAFPVSNIVAAKVAGLRISLPIIVDQAAYQVENLFMIDRTPRPGDSGGLLYDGSDAVGILVALADNFGYFQPLAEAFEHIRKIFNKPIQVF